MKLLILWTFLAFALVSSRCFASVSVAFIEMRDAQGHLVQLEPDGRFAHVAISYHGDWLQALPYWGVQLVTTEQLKKVGTIAEIVTLQAGPEPSSQYVDSVLGKPYDYEYTWSDDAFYCSKLVAKILNIPPRPMTFDPHLWPPQFQKYNGRPGMSPDTLYRILSSQP